MLDFAAQESGGMSAFGTKRTFLPAQQPYPDVANREAFLYWRRT